MEGKKAMSLVRWRFTLEILSGLRYEGLGLRKKGTSKSSEALEGSNALSFILSPVQSGHGAACSVHWRQNLGPRPQGLWRTMGPGRGWVWSHWLDSGLRVIRKEKMTCSSLFTRLPAQSEVIGPFHLTCTCSGEDKANSTRFKKERRKKRSHKDGVTVHCLNWDTFVSTKGYC